MMRAMNECSLVIFGGWTRFRSRRHERVRRPPWLGGRQSIHFGPADYFAAGFYVVSVCLIEGVPPAPSFNHQLTPAALARRPAIGGRMYGAQRRSLPQPKSAERPTNHSGEEGSRNRKDGGQRAWVPCLLLCLVCWLGSIAQRLCVSSAPTLQRLNGCCS